MASSSKATGQHWWLGWYALAYVPDELQEEEGEKLKPTMTKLTEDGDIIYNIFQGDMNGDGYQTTKASSRFKSVNYDSNIKKNYRYVLDESGRNNLVTFVDGKHGLKGACVYKGVQVVPSRDDNEIGHENSAIPLPAPLLYTGVKAVGEKWSTTGMNIFLGSGNDSIENFYPVEEINVDGEKRKVPRVSTDFRNYEGYRNGLPLVDAGDGYEYGLDTITDAEKKVDEDGWFPSVNTYTQEGETDMEENYNQYCYQYWKVLSISNFNKYCAPVNAAGLLYDENTGCRNMAKATKYFPISDYSVTSTAKTADNEYATGIKLKVQLKLNGNAEDGSYFKDVETGSEGNVATLNPSPTEDEQALFNTQQVSFRFNRIGIYAVPMRQYGCSGDEGEMKAQFQIDTEAEPVLFAVCEWDSPVTLSDSGEGLSEFQSDIFIDLSAAVEDSSVIRESAVFYNLYEDDAIDWYKNQLVANASIAEALVNMQIEMGYLRDQKNAKACCPKQEAIQQNKKSYTGLRNLVDANDYDSNSVRNRLAQEEGKAVPADYSDIIRGVTAIGYPNTNGFNPSFVARKGVSGSSAVYSVGSGLWPNSGRPITYEDAFIDDREYEDLVPNFMDGSADAATRIGKLWVRTKLFFEMFSFIAPSNQQNSFVYDYPDSSDTNEYHNVTNDVIDYFGSGTDIRHKSMYNVPKVTVTKTASGLSVEDGSSTTTTLPSDLNSVTEFANEVNRSLENYETKRIYVAYYTQGTTTRTFGYMFKRITEMTLPKIQLYKISTEVYSNINQQLSETGWRIPSKSDWQAILDEQSSNPAKTKEKTKEIRASSKWTEAGGTGSVYPLVGGATGRGGTSIAPSDKPIIYLAIADDVNNVVVFDGSTFAIIPTPSFQESESGLDYVSILCVADAIKVSDGISKYKLGYDSYALMEGSISEGNHNFNAGENSSIFATANYNSIFGGMYNKVSNSDHNAILNGNHNEVLGAVYSVVFGQNNIVQEHDATNGGVPSCRMLLDGIGNVVSGGATSAIFAEFSNIDNAYQCSIIGDKNDIRSAYNSRFLGQYSDSDGRLIFSDMIGYNVHHMPHLYMSRATLTYDHMSTLPSSLQYATSVSLFYSELTGSSIHFWKKTNDSTDSTQIVYSRICAGGGTAGVANTFVCYSDIFACSDARIQASWVEEKTLESVAVRYSALRMSDSSIASYYIDGTIGRSDVNFCDISLGQTLVQLSESNGLAIPHKFNYGVMKLSYSIISRCDSSYVYESGSQHYLTSSQMHYATLIGQMVTLSSSYIRNTHIYGSLSLPAGTLDNHIILGGLDGTMVGAYQASSYISDFGSYIMNTSHPYPMIWSLGGIGMYMNKMVLGNKGVDGVGDPKVGDVLTVVGVEGNIATVAWMPGGTNGKFGTINLEVTFKCANTGWAQGAGGEYAMNLWALRDTSRQDCVVLNGENIANSGNVVETMNGRLGNSDIKFKVDGNGLLVLENTGSDTYMISGSAACVEVSRTNVNEPTSSSYGWNMWDNDDFIPMPLGRYSAVLNTDSNVGANGTYDDMLRYLILGFKTSDDAQGAGELCGVTLSTDQELVCKYSVNINYRKV